MNHQEKNYEIIEEKIDLRRMTSSCSDVCSNIIKYYDTYMNEVDTDTCIAILKLGKYKNSEDYFRKGFDENSKRNLKKAVKLGFRFRSMTIEERNGRLDELYAINTSAKERQGGEMSEEYTRHPEKLDLNETCPWHCHKLYGAFSPDGRWVGYVFSERCGETADSRRILGHSDYVRYGIMRNLWFCFVEDIFNNYPHIKYVQYHLYYIGTQGLIDWKHSVGLRPFVFRIIDPVNP